MKRIISLLLMLALCFSLSACGNGGKSADKPVEDVQTTTEATTTEATTAEETTKEEPIVYNFGDTITTESGMFAFTPIFEGFADAVANWPDENYLQPDGKGVDESNNPFVAEDGKVMMYYSAILEYIGASKENQSFRYSYIIDYDNGYIFKDTDAGSGFGWSKDEEDWSYNETITFEPLDSNKTRYIRFCLEVPEQLEADHEKQTVTIFTIEGQEYTFLVDTAAASAAKAEREAAAAAEQAERMAEVDADLAKEIKSHLQGTFTYTTTGYAANRLYTVTHELTFEGDTVYINTDNTLLGGRLSNKGTYYISNAYIVMDFEDGSQACMPYAYENGQIDISANIEGSFHSV